MTRCLPLLTRLQIIVRLPRESELRENAMERIEEIGQTASHRVPGMLYAVDPLHESRCLIREVRLVFTWAR